MGKRQKQWALNKRRAIKVLLGFKCSNCGTTNNLELDCIKPQGHDHHRIDGSRRATFYMTQLRNGNLRLLCDKCHNQATNNYNMHGANEPNNTLEITPF